MATEPTSSEENHAPRGPDENQERATAIEGVLCILLVICALGIFPLLALIDYFFGLNLFFDLSVSP